MICGTVIAVARATAGVARYGRSTLVPKTPRTRVLVPVAASGVALPVQHMLWMATRGGSSVHGGGRRIAAISMRKPSPDSSARIATILQHPELTTAKSLIDALTAVAQSISSLLGSERRCKFLESTKITQLCGRREASNGKGSGKTTASREMKPRRVPTLRP